MRLSSMFIVSVMLVFIVLCSTVSAEPIAIDSCGTLDQNDTTYILTANVSSSTTCFTIAANNVTLDCNGYNITFGQYYNYYSYGVTITNYNYTTVQNCGIFHNAYAYYQSGIKLASSNNNQFTNNRISVSGSYYSYGLQIDSSSNNVITGNNIFIYHSYGISLSTSDNNTLTDNTVSLSTSAYYGFYTYYSFNNIYTDNRVIGTGSNFNRGFYFVLASNSTLTGNAINTSGQAIYVEPTSGPLYYDHHIDTSNTKFGKPIYYYFSNASITISDLHDIGQLYVANSTNIAITNITSRNDGITLALTTDSTIMNSNVSTIGQSNYGIAIYFGYNNTVSNNNFSTSNINSYASHLYYTDGNNFANNNFSTANEYCYGAYLTGSKYSTFTGNSFNTSRAQALYISSSSNPADYNHSIDTSNTKFGKPIYYYFDSPSTTISDLHDIGQLYVTYSSNVTIRNITSSNDGITLAITTDSNLTGCSVRTAADADYGITLVSYSDGNTIADNNITTTGYYGHGIIVSYSSSNNFTGNNISVSGNYAEGMGQSEASNNNILNNQIDTLSAYYGYGILLQSNSNTNVSENNITISGNYASCISSSSSNVNTISSNLLTSNGGYNSHGVSLSSDSDDSVIGNVITTTGSNSYGFYNYYSTETVMNNTVSTTGDYSYGAYFYSARFSNFTGNSFNVSDALTIFIEPTSNPSYYDHSIDTSNTKFGKPIYYYFDSPSTTISDLHDIGQLYVAYSSNVTIRNITSSNDGITLALTTNSTVTNCSISTTAQQDYGIYLHSSSNHNALTGNNITTSGESGYGVYLLSVANNGISGNNIATTGSSDHGVYLYSSANNYILGNTIVTTGSEGDGIYLQYSTGANNISSNNITLLGSSSTGVYFYSSTNNNLTGNKIVSNNTGNTGVYLTSSSGNNLQDNTVSSTGIGIQFYSSNNNILANNALNANTYGILIQYSTGNSFTATQACSNSDHDLYDSGLGNIFVNSTYTNSYPNNNTYFNQTAICRFIQGLCGQTLIENTDLEEDLLNCPANGVNIGLDNLTFNCQGHKITGTNRNNAGVYSSDYDNTTVQNCTIINFNNGIYMGDSSGGNYTDNNLSGNNYGFSGSSSDYTGISYNEFSNNNYGVHLEDSDNFNVFGNAVENAAYGFYLDNGQENVVNNNTLTGNESDTGIYLYSETSSTLSSNNIHTMANGIYLELSGRINILDNHVENATYGIKLDDSSLNFLSNNTVIGSSGSTGLYVDSTHNTILKNKLVSDVWVQDTAGSNIYNDYARGNRYYLANGSIASGIYDIQDDDGDGWADAGNSLPFNNETVSGHWIGYGQDAHPATNDIVDMRPSAIGLSVIYPGQNINVTKMKWFNVTLNASCTGYKCGNVSISLDPIAACDPENEYACTDSCAEVFNEGYAVLGDWDSDDGYCTDSQDSYVDTTSVCDDNEVPAQADGTCAEYVDSSGESGTYFCPSYERMGRAVTAGTAVQDCVCFGDGSCDIPPETIFDFSRSFFSGESIGTFFEKGGRISYPECIEAGTCDCVTPNVCITRGSTQGLYNAKTQQRFDWSTEGPSGTLWAKGKCANPNFDDWYEIASPQSFDRDLDAMQSTPFCLHLIEDDAYYNISFNNWTNGSIGGGGFNYTRTGPDGTHSFAKTDHANVSYPECIDAGTCDCITSNVCITRGDQQGLFNAVSQSEYDYPGPAGTEWRRGDCNAPQTVNMTWYDAASPRSFDSDLTRMLATPVCMYLPEDDKYYDVQFKSWQSGGGGGFSYSRTNADDGTVDFEKAEQPIFPSYPDCIDAGTCDCIAPDVCLTRGLYRGLYNAYSEEEPDYDSELEYTSPLGTLWAKGTCADTAGTPDEFDSWIEVAAPRLFDDNQYGMMAQPFCIYLPDYEAYYDIHFNTWGSDYSGEFSYYRNAYGGRKGLVSTTDGETPFWTNAISNPLIVPLAENQSELVTFEVQATGDAENTHVFYAYADQGDVIIIQNATPEWNVTIEPSAVLHVTVLAPGSDIDVLHAELFNVTSEVCCSIRDCGTANVSLYADDLLLMDEGTPFYTAAGNPQLTGNLGIDQCENITWLVNTTGEFGTTQTFSVSAVAINDPTINHTSLDWDVNIVRLPTLSLSVLYPEGDVEVTKDQFFNVTLNVSCMLEDCGDIDVSLDPVGDIYFAKTNSSSQDCITDNVCLKRGSSGIIYNSVLENSSNNSVSPKDTEWSVGTCASHGSFGTFLTVVCHGACSLNILNKDFCARLISDDKLVDFYFVNYTSGPQGAIFAYYRSEPETLTKGLVSTTPGTTPFWTTESNPRNVNLAEGESQTVVFYVNASGSVDDTYHFFAYANKTDNMSISDITPSWQVTITLDTLPPVVTLYNPLNQTYNTTSINLDYTNEEENPDGCWYSINDTTNVSTSTNESLTLTEGQNTIRVFCKDTNGQWGSDTASFFISDTLPPVVSLDSPSNGYSNDSASPINVTFSCSATDNQGLSNMSLYITDSNNENFGLNQTDNLTGTSNSSSWILSLEVGNYTWNCHAYDYSGNDAWAANRTIKNNYSEPTCDIVPRISFTSLTTASGYHSANSIRAGVLASNFTNLTIYLYNATGIVTTTTSNLSSYVATFSQLPEGVYRLSATAIGCGESNSTEEKTITLDRTAPSIDITSPDAGYATNSTSLNFTFIATDNLSSLLDCSLYVDNIISFVARDGNSSTIPGASTALQASGLESRAYDWYISCTDAAGNAGTSLQRAFIVDAVPPVISMSSPKSGDILGYNIYLVSNIWDDLSGVDSAWYEILNASNPEEVLANGTMTSQDGWAAVWNSYDGLSEMTANVELRLYANDSLGNMNTTTVPFFIDNVNPSIQLILPTSTGSYLNHNFSLDIMVQDATLNYTKYNLSSGGISKQGAEYFFPSPGTSYNWTEPVNIDNYSEGNYTVSMNAIDAASNTRDLESWFVIDRIPPNVTLVSPSTGYRTDETTVLFDWIAEDAVSSILSCNLTINGKIVKSGIQATSGEHAEYQVDGLNWADYAWNVTCSDDAGNTNDPETRLFIPDFVDDDGDNVHNSVDTCIGNASRVQEEGISNLVVEIGGTTNLTTFNDTKDVVIYNDDIPVLNFTFNFSENGLVMSNISIEAGNNSIIVDLNGQLQAGFTKSLYLRNDDFVSLCVKDLLVSSISEISSNCTGDGEIDFTSCLGDSNGVTIDGITCTDSGSIIRVENLQYSAMIGTPAVPSPPPAPPAHISSSTQKTLTTLTYSFNCSTGELIVFSNPPAAGARMQLFKSNASSPYFSDIDSLGRARFTVTKNDTYLVNISSDLYYGVLSKIQLALCPFVSPRNETAPPTSPSAPKTNQTVNETALPTLPSEPKTNQTRIQSNKTPEATPYMAGGMDTPTLIVLAVLVAGIFIVILIIKRKRERKRATKQLDKQA